MFFSERKRLGSRKTKELREKKHVLKHHQTCLYHNTKILRILRTASPYSPMSSSPCQKSTGRDAQRDPSRLETHQGTRHHGLFSFSHGWSSEWETARRESDPSSGTEKPMDQQRLDHPVRKKRVFRQPKPGLLVVSVPERRKGMKRKQFWGPNTFLSPLFSPEYTFALRCLVKRRRPCTSVGLAFSSPKRYLLKSLLAHLATYQQPQNSSRAELRAPKADRITKISLPNRSFATSRFSDHPRVLMTPRWCVLKLQKPTSGEDAICGLFERRNIWVFTNGVLPAVGVTSDPLRLKE